MVLTFVYQFCLGTCCFTFLHQTLQVVCFCCFLHILFNLTTLFTLKEAHSFHLWHLACTECGIKNSIIIFKNYCCVRPSHFSFTPRHFFPLKFLTDMVSSESSGTSKIIKYRLLNNNLYSFTCAYFFQVIGHCCRTTTS